MKDTNLGSRLLMAASFVKNGDTVCDVGCDHGKLGLYLIQTGRAKKIIATDINIKPLDKAVKLFEENGLSDKRDFRLTDGLRGVENSDKKITHVVIAGMGGITMTKVFEGADFVKDESINYVLLPAQRGFDIRKYLYENGYDITTEKTVRENGKFYTCMLVKYTGVVKQADIFDIYIGKSYENTDYSAKGYFELVLTRLKNKQAGFVAAFGAADEGYAQAIDKVEKLIADII